MAPLQARLAQLGAVRAAEDGGSEIFGDQPGRLAQGPEENSGRAGRIAGLARVVICVVSHPYRWAAPRWGGVAAKPRLRPDASENPKLADVQKPGDAVQARVSREERAVIRRRSGPTAVSVPASAPTSAKAAIIPRRNYPRPHVPKGSAVALPLCLRLQRDLAGIMNSGDEQIPKTEN